MHVGHTSGTIYDWNDDTEHSSTIEQITAEKDLGVHLTEYLNFEVQYTACEAVLGRV